MSLKSTTIRGAFWSFGELIASKGANFIFQIILARLLSPEAFGILAMVMVVITLGDMLVDSGIASSLIRSKEVTEVDFSSVFFMNVALSLFVFIGIYFLAPYIALFYERPQITNIIRVFSLIIPIKSLMIVQKSILTRKMDFRTQMMIETPSLIISGLIGITLAYYGFGVWSLIYMQIIQAILISIQYWIFNSWRPKLIFNYEVWKKHFVFGYKLTLSYLMHISYYELHNILLGKYFNAQILGLYNRSFALQNLPGFIIHRAVEKVSIPLFSKFQDDNTQLTAALVSITSPLLIVFFSIIGIMYMNAHEIIYLIFGSKWLGMIPIFKIVCLAGIFQPLYGYNYSILVAKGKSNTIFIAQFFTKLFGILGSIYFIFEGLYPFLYFLVFANFVNFVVIAIYIDKEIKYKIHIQLWHVFSIFFLSLIVSLLSQYVIENIISNLVINSSLLSIALFIIVYSGILLFISELLQFEPYRKSKKIILDIIKNYLNRS